jgi:hypothetical protein
VEREWLWETAFTDAQSLCAQEGVKWRAVARVTADRVTGGVGVVG